MSQRVKIQVDGLCRSGLKNLLPVDRLRSSHRQILAWEVVNFLAHLASSVLAPVTLQPSH